MNKANRGEKSRESMNNADEEENRDDMNTLSRYSKGCIFPVG